MKTNLEDLYNDLFSILNEKDKPILRRIRLSHEERETELLNVSESYKADILMDEKEIDKMVDQIESLANRMDQSNEVKIKLKKRIGKFRKDRKELISKRQSIAVSKGLLKAKYTKTIEVMENIYKICESNRSTNIKNLKAKIKKISKGYVSICKKCKHPEYRCCCE